MFTFFFNLSAMKIVIEEINRDFPGGPMVTTLPSRAGCAVSILGQKDKIPHTLQPKYQNIKLKQYCDQVNQDFKNGPH